MMTLHMTPEEMNTMDSAELALTVAEHATAIHPAHWPSARGPMHGSVRAVSQGNRPRWYDGVLNATLDWCWR